MRVVPLAFGLVFLAGTALAASADSQMGLQLTQQMYCDVKDLIGGNIGMLVGFAVAILGLVKLIQGGGFGAIVLILVGASITAVPSLIESSLKGLGEVLSGSGITSNKREPGIGCGASGFKTTVE